MGAVWMKARAELGGRARSVAALAIVVALAGGAALGALSGARRTDTVISRFVAYSHPAQGVVVGDPGLYPPIARLPQVAATHTYTRMILVRLNAAGRPDRSVLLNALGAD